MSAKHPREREAKFQVAPDQHPALFAESISFDGYTSQSLGTISQIDTYLDTAAYDLLRHGITLRVRDKDASYEAGIKGIQAARKGAIQARTDIAMSLPPLDNPLDATTWPAAIQELLGPYAVRLADLRPLISVRQQRQKAHLRPTTSEIALAEWSLDEVWIEMSESDTDAEDAKALLTHFHELEIEELAGGHESEPSPEDDIAFAALVDHVQGQYDLKPSYTSKLVRGLEAAIAQAHEKLTAITPSMTLEAAGRLLLHQQLFQIMLNEHGIRYHKKARYVHDMRVAIRRARAAIQLCQNAIPVKTLAPQERGLRRLGRALGAVRDLDVALANLRAFRRQQPQSQRKGIKLLRSELKSRHRHAHADLLALLDSKKHRKFIVEFTEFCLTPTSAINEVKPTPYEAQPNQVCHTVPSLIFAAFEAVRAYETAFMGDALPPPETFHACRIRAKYLRYLLEFTQHLLGEDGEMLVVQLTALQEHLGELNDAHVEQERLHQWAQTLQSDDLGEAIDARLAQVATRIHELTSAAPSHLASFVSPPNRQTLAKAIARL